MLRVFHGARDPATNPALQEIVGKSIAHGRL